MIINNKMLLQGNKAAVYGALLGGVTHFFGYPITPACEITNTSAVLFKKFNKVFLQTESEISAINMILGANSAGARAMTASSGPGISLMNEAISYIAGSEVPCVIINVQRVGPGLGYIWPEQSDYNMVVKGGGHGIYKNIVFAPNSAQEMCDFSYRAFEIAEKYRITVFILSDAYIGQMMEIVSLPIKIKFNKSKKWGLLNNKNKNIITSIYDTKEDLNDKMINRLLNKYKKIEDEIVSYEEYNIDMNTEFIISSFGICSRICFNVIDELKKNNINIGMIRPITLFPFPKKKFQSLPKKIKKIFVVELNEGQMIDDIKISINNNLPIIGLNWYGGNIPTVNEIVSKIKEEIIKEVK